MPSRLSQRCHSHVTTRHSLSNITSANRHGANNEKYFYMSAPRYDLTNSELYKNVDQHPAQHNASQPVSKLNQKSDCSCDSNRPKTKTLFKTRSDLQHNMYVLPMTQPNVYLSHQETREHVPVKYEGFRPVSTKHFRPSACSGYQVTTTLQSTPSWFMTKWPYKLTSQFPVKAWVPPSKPVSDYQSVTGAWQSALEILTRNRSCCHAI